jgi:hypothetical protein
LLYQVQLQLLDHQAKSMNVEKIENKNFLFLRTSFAPFFNLSSINNDKYSGLR